MVVRVEVAPGGLAAVPGVARHVDVEAVVAGAEADDLSLDEDSEPSLLHEERAGDVGVLASRDQLYNCLGRVSLDRELTVRAVADAVGRDLAEKAEPE